MMSLLGQTLDQTARSSLIKDLKRQLILRAAKELSCDKVFTGECATSLAITLLSGKAMYIRLADIKSLFLVIFRFSVVNISLYALQSWMEQFSKTRKAFSSNNNF